MGNVATGLFDECGRTVSAPFVIMARIEDIRAWGFRLCELYENYGCEHVAFQPDEGETPLRQGDVVICRDRDETERVAEWIYAQSRTGNAWRAMLRTKGILLEGCDWR